MNLGSWRSTLTGLANIALGLYLLYQGQTTVALASLSAGIQGLVVRDNKVTSEEAGAKPPEPTLVEVVK